MIRILILLLILSFSIPAQATDFIDEDWETGTPAACWPCKTVDCSTDFNGWDQYCAYQNTTASLSTADHYGGSRSFYQYGDPANGNGANLIYYISGSPTTIYFRFYLKLGTGYSTFVNGVEDNIIHWIFTNSAYSSTGFRLNLTHNTHWGGCPAGDLCLLPEGDGGDEWWDGTSPAWTSTAADDFLQYAGVWTCFEYKMQISGSSVILTEYINGVQKRGPVTGPGQNTSNFDRIILSAYDNKVSGATLDYYIDDIVVSDAYIGPLGGDTTPPVVTISTSDPSNITSNSLSISGTASDAVGVTSCKYRIGSAPDATHGTAITGTTSWSGTATGFSEGANTLYVGCTDAAGNWGSDSITVNLNTPPGQVKRVTIKGAQIK